MTISGPAVPVFCMYLVAAERQGADLSKLDGTLQTDIFKEYIAQKEWLFAPEPHLRLIGDLMEYCAARDPALQAAVRLRLPHPRGRLDGRAGARVHAGRRVRLRRARAVPRPRREHVRARAVVLLRLARGLLRGDRQVPGGPADLGPLAAERYGATSEKALWLRFHTQTAGVSLTAQQPVNNVVRTAIEALAAVLGGTNSLHTNALDETLALPTDESAEIALRTQQVIMEESGVTNVADPLGGSWYVEALTDKIEAEAEAIFDRILAMGGRRRARASAR